MNQKELERPYIPPEMIGEMKLTPEQRRQIEIEYRRREMERRRQKEEAHRKANANAAAAETRKHTIYNSKNPSSIKYNGTVVKKIVYAGKTIWEANPY